jgi:hypothetical protein
MGRTINKYYRYQIVYPDKKVYARTMVEVGTLLGLCRSTVERMKRNKWTYKPPKVEHIDFQIEEISIPIYNETTTREKNPYEVTF